MMPLEIVKHLSVRTGVKLALVCGLVIALSACGRKGPLQPPSPQTPAVGEAQTETPSEQEKPDEGFILDPLL